MMPRSVRLAGYWLSLAALLAGFSASTMAWAEPAPSEPSTPPKAAGLSRQALGTVRRVAIQHAGRHKPFDSFAWETLKFLTGSPRVNAQDPVITVLSIAAYSEDWQGERLIAVPFRPLREQLGLAPKQSHVSYNELVATKKLMRMLPAIVQKQQQGDKLTMIEQETMDVYERFVTLNALFEQDLSLVPSRDARASWLPVFEAADHPPEIQETLRTAWTGFMDAARSGDHAAGEAAATQLAATLAGVNPAAYPASWRLNLEVLYNRASPFRAARVVYALAALLFVLGLSPARKAWARGATAVMVAAFVLHGADIALRVIIGGRPPVSNFYETMLWLPFVAVAIALFFEWRYRARYFGLAASVLAAIVLLLADYVPLDPSIAPVVAVLRSNLWLTVHVLTIVASYGALALATVLAHLYAGAFVARRPAASLETLGALLYRSVQVGIVLLAGGIMLGAVWANASWGRYWGWDPKETWALITLLWFLAMLHGRFMGWLKGIGLALGTIAGFFLLLMTYYGVSFYLVGLHSYAGGHAKPIPTLLIGYLVAELAFLALVGMTALRRRLT